MISPINNDKFTALPLCYYGHPALRKKSIEIVTIDEKVVTLSERMMQTMYANDGIGLAGPQVGYNVNLIILNIPMNDREDRNPGFTSPGEMSLLPMMPLVIINPMLSGFSDNKTTSEEGCLSMPGVTAEVTRPEFIQLEGKLLNGRLLSYRCGGLLARCLQHECDHLNGILFTDLLPSKVHKSLSGQLKKLKNSLELSSVG